MRLLALVVPLLLTLAACGGEDDVTRTEGGVLRLGREAARDTTERAVRLGGRSLVLEFGAGSVTVVGSGAEEARFRFEREARGATAGEARERLGRLAIEEAGDGASYRFAVRPESWAEARVDAVALVPRGTPLVVRLGNGAVRLSGTAGRVEVHVENGPVEAAGLAGEEVRIETRNGDVRAAFAEVPRGARVEIETKNGAVTVTLPPDASADVEAQTAVGEVAVEGLTFSDRRLEQDVVGSRFRGRLGQGGARVRAATSVGDVALVGGRVEALEGVEALQPPPDTATTGLPGEPVPPDPDSLGGPR